MEITLKIINSIEISSGGVTEVEVGEGVEDECGGVGCVWDGSVGEAVVAGFAEVHLGGFISEFS